MDGEKIKEVMKKLEYGPAPESADAANEWIAKHNGKFGFYSDGKFHHPEDRLYTPTVCPGTGETLAEIIEAEAEDVEEAVRAARRAFVKWSSRTGYERARFLYAIARHMQKHARVLSVLESMDNGKSFRETRDADIPLCVRHFYYHAGWAQLMDTELSFMEPLGVVAQVIPWNFPLLMLAWKIAPALAMGNTVVLKPAPSTRLSAMLFAEICAEAGLPPGVVNILPGGNDLGFALVNHPDVDKVAFTGSTGVGKLLRRSTAGTGKKLSLELGGKSPMVVFDNADLDTAVEGVVNAIWFNQGQVCCAGSRLLVQENVYPQFVAKLRRRMDNLRIGGPLDKCVDVGAIVNEAQLARVQQYVQIARDEGATVYQSPLQQVPGKGLFYPPTLVTDVETSSQVVIDEIFGPVLVVLTFRSPAEAVKLANNTAFGLSASVWTQDVPQALDVAFKIRAGVVWVNSHNLFDAAAGFGGMKESGYGRESGREGLYEYVRVRGSAPPYRVFTVDDVKAPWGGTVPATPEPVGDDGFHVRERVDRTYKVFVGGKQVRPDGQYSRVILGPNRTVLGEVSECNRKDVRNAVEAAYKAAPGWGKRAAYNRSQILYFIAENLDARREEFVAQLAGRPGGDQEEAAREVAATVERLFYWAAWADKHGGSVQETPLYGATVAIHEPVGVIGIACPDNSPLLNFVSLFAPAIVRGNTCVIVPSPAFPLCATSLFQVFECSDLPPGVVNILTGDRDHLTKYLTEHREVDAMWYFGTAIGSYHVEHRSADNLKRTQVNYGKTVDWFATGAPLASQMLYHCTQVKNIWIPAGV